jgi:hypothetical protein
VTKKGYNLKVAYVLGDNLFDEMKDIKEQGLPPHLDSDNSEVTVADHALDLLEKGDKPIVSANAYLGAREIVKGLEEGADIIIAGRVADASPVRTAKRSLPLQYLTLLGNWCSLVLAFVARHRL